jgi:hypothetical protein
VKLAAQSSESTPIADETEPPAAQLNTDTLTPTGATDAIPLDPAGEATLAFTYAVTTQRAGTAIHAELRDADGALAGGWTVRAQPGTGSWTSGNAAIDVTEQVTLAPGTAFTLTIVVTAPAALAEAQSVSLYVRSTVTTDAGSEPGVADNAPVATLTATLPLPPGDVQDADAPIVAGTPVGPGTAICAQAAPSPAGTPLAAGTYATFACTNTDTSPFSFGVSDLTPTWEWASAPGPGCEAVEPASWSTAGSAVQGPFDPAANATICVFLRPTTPASGEASESGSLQFEYLARGRRGLRSSPDRHPRRDAGRGPDPDDR